MYFYDIVYWHVIIFSNINQNKPVNHIESYNHFFAYKTYREHKIINHIRNIMKILITATYREDDVGVAFVEAAILFPGNSYHFHILKSNFYLLHLIHYQCIFINKYNLEVVLMHNQRQ